MKRQSNILCKLCLTLILTLGLAACGGKDEEEASVTYSISTDVSEIAFVHYETEELSNKQVITIHYDGDGLLVGFAPNSPVANWLSYETKVIDSTTTELHIDLANTQFIAATDLTATIRVSTGDITSTNLVSTDINVSLKIWQMQFMQPNIAFNSKFAAENVEEQSLEIVAEGTQWSVSSGADWLSTDITEGEGSTSLVLNVDPQKITNWGKHEAELTFTDKVSGDSRTFPVSYAVDAYRFYASDNTLAFSAVGGQSSLTQTVEILSNAATTAGWQANSEANWLSLNPDLAGNKLTVNANASSLAAGLHRAQIIISGTDSLAPISEVIEVALYKQTANATTKSFTLAGVTSPPLIVDPLRPYLYFASNNHLLVFNSFTSELVFAEETPLGNGKIANLVMHPSGEKLLLNVTPEDKAEDALRDTLVSFSPDDLAFTLIDESELTQALTYNPKNFIELEGLVFVVSQAMEFASEDFNRVFWDTDSAYFYNLLRQPGNQASFYLLNGQLSLERYIASVNQYVDNGLVITRTHQLLFTPEPDSIIFDFNVDNNEQNLYLASTDTEWLSFDGVAFEDKMSLHGTTDFKTFDTSRSDNGDIFFLRIDQELNYLLVQYNQQRQEMMNKTLAVESAVQASVTPDGLRLITTRPSEDGLDTKVTLTNIN